MTILLKKCMIILIFNFNSNYKDKYMLNLANLLTISRILIIPIIILCFFINQNWSNWVIAILFIVACITDFFDGYVARHMNQISKLGRFLDPIADKLLVASLLMMLVYTKGISVYGIIPAIIILCREILVSGLREFLAELQVSMPVTKLAKWKTTSQMIALAVLSLAPALNHDFTFHVIGEIFLWIAAILTVMTGYDYLKSGLKHMQD